METMIEIMDFVNNKQLGNISIARRDAPCLQREFEILNRLQPPLTHRAPLEAVKKTGV